MHYPPPSLVFGHTELPTLRACFHWRQINVKKPGALASSMLWIIGIQCLLSPQSIPCCYSRPSICCSAKAFVSFTSTRGKSGEAGCNSSKLWAYVHLSLSFASNGAVRQKNEPGQIGNQNMSWKQTSCIALITIGINWPCNELVSLVTSKPFNAPSCSWPRQHWSVLKCLHMRSGR